jgi:hypothetical protein
MKYFRCATFQATFQESIIFSSLLSSRNLFSSSGLVKISTSFSLVIPITLDCMISQEMMSDVYVFGSRMLTGVVSNFYSTPIFT